MNLPNFITFGFINILNTFVTQAVTSPDGIRNYTPPDDLFFVSNELTLS